MTAPPTTLPDDGPLQSSGNAEVDVARAELILAVNFKQGHPFTDPDFFYPTEHQKHRFERNGFTTHVLYYREPKVWWNELVALIPDNIDTAKDVPLCINFHGGGFFTGDARFQSWCAEHKLRLARQNKAIILAPNYPLLPFFNGTDIVESLDAIQVHLLSDKLDADLRSINPAIKIRRTGIFLTGESAGGWLAARIFLNQLISINSKKLDISALYLNYPMLRHYQRPCPDEGLEFVGTPLTKDEVHAAGRNLLEKTKKYRTVLEKAGMKSRDVPVPRVWAPMGMGAGMTACCTDDVWTQIFQNGKGTPDVIEHLEKETTSMTEGGKSRQVVNRQKLPGIFICHPVGDLNVPIDVSRDFVGHMKRLYGDAFKIHFHELGRLDHPEKVGEKNDYVPRHGFDNEVLPENETWLETIISGIERAWHSRQS